MQRVESTINGPCDAPNGRRANTARYEAQQDGETLLFTCPRLAGESGKEVVCFVRERIQGLLDGGIHEGSTLSLRTPSVTIGIDRELPNVATVDGELRQLTPDSYKTLQALTHDGEEDVSFEDIYSRTHQRTLKPNTVKRNVMMQIKRLKKELGSEDCIEPIENYGYRINTQVAEPGQDGEKRESNSTIQTAAARVTIDEKFKNKVWIDGVCKYMSLNEYAFVRALMKKKGDYIRHEDFYKEIFDDKTYLPANYLNKMVVLAFHVKERLGDISVVDHIWEVGYRMDTPPTEPSQDGEQRASVITRHTNLGRVTIDKGKYKAFLNGNVIPLTTSEFEYLQVFMKTPNVRLTQTQLYRLVYPEAPSVPSNVDDQVNSRVYKINRKFGHKREKKFIKTSPTYGHMFIAKREEAA